MNVEIYNNTDLILYMSHSKWLLHSHYDLTRLLISCNSEYYTFFKNVIMNFVWSIPTIGEVCGWGGGYKCSWGLKIVLEYFLIFFYKIPIYTILIILSLGHAPFVFVFFSFHFYREIFVKHSVLFWGYGGGSPPSLGWREYSPLHSDLNKVD